MKVVFRGRGPDGYGPGASSHGPPGLNQLALMMRHAYGMSDERMD